MAGTDSTTSTGSTNAAATAQAAAAGSGSGGASQAVRDNTDSLGRVDTQGLVNDVKASSPDIQQQRDFAAQAARQIENRDARREFVQALEDQGVARKPGFFERQWQGVKGLGIGVYEGGAGLVTGAYELGKMGVQGVGAAAEFSYNYATDGQYRQQTNAAVGRAADAAVDGVVAAKDYAADRIANPSKLGDDATTVGTAVRSGVDAVANKVEQVYDKYDKARSEAVIQGTTDELAGKLVGRVGFEVASLAVPVTKLGAAGKGAAAAADAAAAVKTVDATVDVSRLSRSSDSLTGLANSALARTGDDAARVARVEQEARATATTATSGTSTARGVEAADRVKPASSIDAVRSSAPSASDASAAPGAATHAHAHGFSARDINPHTAKAGGDLNCVKCSMALDATLGGAPAQALPGLASKTFAGAQNILENAYGAKLTTMDSQAAIVSAMTDAGNGARGIVIGYQSGASYSHAFNVANQHGTIRFLDGQIGTAAKNVEQYDRLWFIRTNASK
jgi:Papain fold toxin 1, glutamine deamidase